MQRSILVSSLMLLGLLAGSGCAISASAPDLVATRAEVQPLRPRGPGAVFESADAAAIDGLWLAYLETLEQDRAGTQRARGGTVFPVAGGFSYTPLVAAREATPGRVPLVLKPADVAHFHSYPRADAHRNRINETHSPNDRANVDQRDPLRRPSYVLTPSLRVRRYDALRRETRIARIDMHSRGLTLAQAIR